MLGVQFLNRFSSRKVSSNKKRMACRQCLMCVLFVLLRFLPIHSHQNRIMSMRSGGFERCVFFGILYQASFYLISWKWHRNRNYKKETFYFVVSFFCRRETVVYSAAFDIQPVQTTMIQFSVNAACGCIVFSHLVFKSF